MEENVLRSAKGFEQGESTREYLTYSEVQALTHAECKYPVLKNAFLFSCLAGLRWSDIDKLRWSEVRDEVSTSVRAGTTGNSLIDAVLLERRYEFVGEAPYRWMDIWRYKLGDQVYGPIYGMSVAPTPLGDLDIANKSITASHTRVWNEKFYLFPLPQAALDINVNLLPQNPGW